MWKKRVEIVTKYKFSHSSTHTIIKGKQKINIKSNIQMEWNIKYLDNTTTQLSKFKTKMGWSDDDVHTKYNTNT